MTSVLCHYSDIKESFDSLEILLTRTARTEVRLLILSQEFRDVHVPVLIPSLSDINILLQLITKGLTKGIIWDQAEMHMDLLHL